jgi:hypothetical protein
MVAAAFAAAQIAPFHRLAFLSPAVQFPTTIVASRPAWHRLERLQ